MIQRWVERNAEGGGASLWRGGRPWLAPLFSALLLAAVLVRTDLAAARQALAGLPVSVLIAGLGLLLVRDVLCDVACWRSTLLLAGHRVPFLRLAEITVAYAPVKFLLPFKAGDAVRVVALHRSSGVPLSAGAVARLAAMALQLGVLVLFTALLAAVHTGHALVALLGVPGAIGIAAIGIWVGSGGRLAPLASALLFAALSAACSVGLFAMVVGAVRGGAPQIVDLLVITAVVLACSLPATARGIGLRELMLTTFAVSWGVGSRTDLLGAALAVSAAEVAVVLVLAVGVVISRLTRVRG